MATSKKRRKIVVFSLLGLVLLGLVALVLFRKREPVITVQTEKVARRNLTEIVSANGKIQPVIQVKISPEVSGEIIALPVKEGQAVTKGDLIMKIKPDFYLASRNQAEASYRSSLASKATAEANLEKARAEFKRNEELFNKHLVSESVFLEYKTAFDIASAQLTSATHQVEMSKALLARADEELSKTTIVAPLTGTVSKLNSQLGERVVGTATMAGTEVMTIADLNEMEARVDIGEMDVVLITPGQKVKLDVDAFKDRKFSGEVTEIANSSRSSLMASSSSQDATKFEVKIRIKEKESFRPGMSVTADIETRYRTNVLTVPIASVTTRLPKEKDKKNTATNSPCVNCPGSNSATTAASANHGSSNTVITVSATNATDAAGTNSNRVDKKKESKPIEVVFIMVNERAKMAPVKIGISDDSYWEILEGIQEGQDVVSGGFRAISRELEDGKKVKKGPPPGDKDKDKDKEGEKEKAG
jgi:HlyD family secretion protein